MSNYFIDSFRRKMARRFTKKYPVRIDTFNVGEYGSVKFANWENPLVHDITIESQNVKFFEKFLGKGDFGIDIGANIGIVSVTMSLITGKSGLVIGFDPNPYVFDIFSENAALNPDKTNIVAYNYAITDNDGDFFYNSSEASFNNGGVSTVEHNKHGKYALKTKIKGINLEKFLEANYADKMDKLKLIKIDTEGYDKEIIKSISGLLMKYKPSIITECFGKNTNEEKFEQFELLDKMGYALFHIKELNFTSTVTPILTKEDMLKWGHFDLYASRKD